MTIICLQNGVRCGIICMISLVERLELDFRSFDFVWTVFRNGVLNGKEKHSVSRAGARTAYMR